MEVFTLQRAGRNVNDVCHARAQRSGIETPSINAETPGEDEISPNQVTSPDEEVSGDETMIPNEDTSRKEEIVGNWQRTRGAVIAPSKDSRVPSLRFKISKAEKKILKAIPESQFAAQHSDFEAFSQEVREAAAEGGLAQYSDTTSTWMALPLQDPMIRFAVCHPSNLSNTMISNVVLQISKRTMQLTGHRIPDFTMSKVNTLSDLHSAFKAKEKPKKLSQTPQLQKLKVEIPNVTVHATRRTPIHKEKEVGRWKVIEDELRLRDLPVTGSRFQGAKVPLHLRA